jgi:archaeosortase B (VPXXXP-CTERM-specific)
MTAKCAEHVAGRHICEARQPVLRILFFLLLSVALNLIFRIPGPLLKQAWYLVVATTRASAWLMSALGLEPSVSANSIALTNQTLLINLECTAIYLMILFGAFVLVYPAKWPRRAIGLLLGIPAIFGANVLRLLLVAYVVEFKPKYFEFFHDYTWQVAFIVFVVVLWLMWIEKVVGYERKASVSG